MHIFLLQLFYGFITDKYFTGFYYGFIIGNITSGELEADKIKRAIEREEQAKRRQLFEERKSAFINGSTNDNNTTSNTYLSELSTKSGMAYNSSSKKREN